jgi:poly(3-hydroxybutyrate) depolymerase
MGPVRTALTALACLILAAGCAGAGLVTGRLSAGVADPRGFATFAPTLVEPQLALLTMDAAPTPGSPVLNPTGLYVPQSLDGSRPLQVLLALHGMGSNGANIAGRLRSCADEHGWVVIAPSMGYRDYMDHEQVRLDAQENIPRLRDLLDQVRSQLPDVPLADRVLVYGFSRGAQMAHRLALFYPNDVRAVATLSAGSYTLPDFRPRSASDARQLEFPFGIGDLERYAGRPFDTLAFARIRFWIGVGDTDVVAAETSRAWDALEGSTRVDRATRFADRIQRLGGTVALRVFVDTGHQETAAMRSSACAFLAERA